MTEIGRSRHLKNTYGYDILSVLHSWKDGCDALLCKRSSSGIWLRLDTAVGHTHTHRRKVSVSLQGEQALPSAAGRSTGPVLHTHTYTPHSSQLSSMTLHPLFCFLSATLCLSSQYTGPQSMSSMDVCTLQMDLRNLDSLWPHPSWLGGWESVLLLQMFRWFESLTVWISTVLGTYVSSLTFHTAVVVCREGNASEYSFPSFSGWMNTRAFHSSSFNLIVNTLDWEKCFFGYVTAPWLKMYWELWLSQLTASAALQCMLVQNKGGHTS